jgi:N-acetylated-alpha-linked acidic dipeptidase
VIVGAHYDSLTAGAIDNGGSVAVLLELMRVLNQQYNVTWKPRRTVLFAFWDGEEMGQIGSTEFIEVGLLLRLYKVCLHLCFEC